MTIDYFVYAQDGSFTLGRQGNRTSAITWRTSRVAIIRVKMGSHMKALGGVGRKENVTGTHLEDGISESSRKDNNILWWKGG
jgi:hypothetical protein